MNHYLRAKIQHDELSIPTKNLLNHSPNFHPDFQDPFQGCLEDSMQQKTSNSLLHVHKNKIIMQTIAFEGILSLFDLLSSPLDLFQSLENIHPYFYDPIEIQLEENLQERVIVKEVSFCKYVSNRFPQCIPFCFFVFFYLIIFMFLLLMFDVYIHVENKMIEWLHRKYNFTQFQYALQIRIRNRLI